VEIPVLCLSHPFLDADSLHFAQLTVPQSVEFLAGGFALSHNLAGRHQFITLERAGDGSTRQGCFVVALGGMESNELAKLRAIRWRPKLEVGLGIGAWTAAGAARLRPGDFTTVVVPVQDGSVRLWWPAEPTGSNPPIRLHVTSRLKGNVQYRVLAGLADGRLLPTSRASVETKPPNTIVAVLDYDAALREFTQFQVQTRPVQFVNLGTPDFSFLASPPPLPAPATSFGAMREVTLNDMDDSRGGEALDLDSGRLLDLVRSNPFEASAHSGLCTVRIASVNPN
jgi:hypothetical protein